MRAVAAFSIFTVATLPPGVVQARDDTQNTAEKPINTESASASPSPSREVPTEQYGTVVRGRRHDVDRTVASERRIGRRVLSSTTPRTADELLEHVPGVLISQHGSEGKGVQIFLRGFDAAHGSDVEVTVAGLPVNELSNVHGSGYVDLGFVIPEVVRAVRVSKGPFRPGQGSFAMAGSVDFELGVPFGERGLRVSYEAGSSNRHRPTIVWAPVDGPISNFVAAHVVRDDGFGANRRTQRAGGIAEWRLSTNGPVGDIDVLAAFGVAGFELPGAVRHEDVLEGIVPFHGSYNDGTNGESWRALVALSQRQRVGQTLLRSVAYVGWRKLYVSNNFTGYLYDSENGDRFAQRHASYGAGLRVNLQRRLSEWLVLDGGATWHSDRLTQREDNQDDAGMLVQPTRDLNGSQHAGALYAGFVLKPLPAVRVAVGGRADVLATQARDKLSGSGAESAVLWQPAPRLSLAISPFSHWTLYAAYGRGLRYPEARAVASASQAASENKELLRYRGGTAQITSSDAMELGLKWSQSHRFAATLSGFGTWIEHETIFDHVSGTILQLNATQRVGAEFGLQTRPWSWLWLHVDATVVSALFVESREPVPGAPRQLVTATAVAGMRHGPFCTLHILGLGPRPLAHGAQAAGAALVDVGVGWRWEDAHVGLHVDNVLDTQWCDGEYHFASRWDRTSTGDRLPVVHQVAGPPLTVRAHIGVQL